MFSKEAVSKLPLGFTASIKHPEGNRAERRRQSPMGVVNNRSKRCSFMSFGGMTLRVVTQEIRTSSGIKRIFHFHNR